MVNYTAERRANLFTPPDTSASLRERVSRIIDTLYDGLTNRDSRAIENLRAVLPRDYAELERRVAQLGDHGLAARLQLAPRLRRRHGRLEVGVEVLADRLSAHAAMVKAGFRPKTISVPVGRPERVAAYLRKHMPKDALARLIELLTKEDQSDG